MGSGMLRIEASKTALERRMGSYLRRRSQSKAISLQKY